MKMSKAGAVLAGCLFSTIALLHSQGTKESVDWPVYGGSPGGMRYSSLKQINQRNVQELQEAWSFDVGDGAGSLETNPIVVSGVLYGYTPAQKVFAVNALVLMTGLPRRAGGGAAFAAMSPFAPLFW